MLGFGNGDRGGDGGRGVVVEVEGVTGERLREGKSFARGRVVAVEIEGATGKERVGLHAGRGGALVVVGGVVVMVVEGKEKEREKNKNKKRKDKFVLKK